MKLLKVTVASVISFSALGSVAPAFAAEDNRDISNMMTDAQTERAKKPIKFGKDKKGATAWANEYFKPWKKKLNNDQRSLLSDPLSIKKMNKDMEKFRAKPELRSQQTQNDIKLLDKAFKESTAKLKEDMYVHKKLKGADVGMPIAYWESFYEPNTKNIDKDKYQKLKHDFKFGMINSFMDVDLTESSASESEPIRLDLKIPAGTSIGHLDQDHILLSRDHGFEVTKTSIIVSEGRQVIKVEAALVSKSKIKQKIKKAENTMNEQFRNLIDQDGNPLGIDGNLVKYDFDGFISSSMLDKVQDSMKQLTNNVPNDLLIKILKKMNPDGRFTFVDQTLTNFSDENKDGTLAWYHTLKNSILFNVGHEHYIKPNHDQHFKKEITETILHEFGHAVDNLLPDRGWITITKTFINAYNLEKDKTSLRDYLKSTPQEFFAGVFSYLYAPDPTLREQIKKEAPETCKIILDAVEKGIIPEYDGIV
ncbi:hypothetical protein OCA23_27480 [Bacillus cereus]|nr:hypothetical protein [Bacillus cereus]